VSGTISPSFSNPRAPIGGQGCAIVTKPNRSYRNGRRRRRTAIIYAPAPPGTRPKSRGPCEAGPRYLLGLGFVSLTEALDLTTPAGRAMAGLLAVFAEFEREILRERVRAGLAHARMEGKRLGRPQTAGRKVDRIRELHDKGVSKAEISRRLKIGRTSVRRLLTVPKGRRTP